MYAPPKKEYFGIDQQDLKKKWMSLIIDSIVKHQ